MKTRVPKVLHEVFHGFSDHELLTRAAALAFYSAFSFAPVLLLVLWMVSVIRPDWNNQLVVTLTNIMGSGASSIAELVIRSAQTNPRLRHLYGGIGLVVTLFSALAVFTQMQQSLNHVWNIKPAPEKAVAGWLLARARAFALLVGIAFLMIVSFAATALVNALIPSGSIGWNIVEDVVGAFLLVVAFGAMYRILPDASIAWADAVRGALLTTLLFMAGKFVISLYVVHSSVSGAYGPASALMVLLMWVYYASTIVLVGAELTHGLSSARGERTPPKAFAKPE
ncbi:MAG TPA: YihY/virulence factor BrkB family protein [Dyella sp.]